jgi:aspartokinase
VVWQDTGWFGGKNSQEIEQNRLRLQVFNDLMLHHHIPVVRHFQGMTKQQETLTQ